MEFDYAGRNSKVLDWVQNSEQTQTQTNNDLKPF
jgi:hypothetical protein